MPLLGGEGDGRVTEHYFLQGHLRKRHALAQFFAELVRSEKVYLFGGILYVIQKVSDTGIKQRFATGDEDLLWLEAPDSLHVKVMDIFRDTLLIELVEQGVLGVGGTPGTFGVAGIENLHANVFKHPAIICHFAFPPIRANNSPI